MAPSCEVRDARLCVVTLDNVIVVYIILTALSYINRCLHYVTLHTIVVTVVYYIIYIDKHHITLTQLTQYNLT